MESQRITREEANKEAQRIIRERNRKADEIILEAKEKGTWRMGLDSNRDLFKKLDEETKKKLRELKARIDDTLGEASSEKEKNV